MIFLCQCAQARPHRAQLAEEARRVHICVSAKAKLGACESRESKGRSGRVRNYFLTAPAGAVGCMAGTTSDESPRLQTACTLEVRVRLEPPRGKTAAAAEPKPARNAVDGAKMKLRSAANGYV